MLDVGRIETVGIAVAQHRARRLRRRQTEAEASLWEVLRGNRLGDWKWKRQVPVGPYIIDFLCRETGLIVGLDGGVHIEQAAYDARRTFYLERQGFRVLRFWNNDLKHDLDAVRRAILQACGGHRLRTPLPPRSGEGEAG